MKGTIKLLSILMIAIMLVAVVSVPVHAEDADGAKKPTAVISELEGKISEKGSENTEGIAALAAKVIRWLRNVSVIAGAILLTVIGFKYMLGSAEEKADYKKSLIPLVVGIIVVMSATQIMTMIFSFLE